MHRFAALGKSDFVVKGTWKVLGDKCTRGETQDQVSSVTDVEKLLRPTPT